MQLSKGEFEGKQVQVYRSGRGPRTLLLHGIGPGTSVQANFQALIDGLGANLEFFGIDLLGFGGSDRKEAGPFFDFALWVRQARAALRQLPGDEPVFVVGQSLGGAIALTIAADEPRIRKVVVTGCGGARLKLNPAIDRFWRLPRSKDELREALYGAFHARAMVTDAVVDQRFNAINGSGPGAYFDLMMQGDKQAFLDSAVVPAQVLARVQQPVLMIHGRDDQICPVEESALPMSKLLPRADLAILAECGHNPARERPPEFLALVRQFLLP
jgi:2-hydroxymuconate-semialdehyde hydrolase